MNASTRQAYASHISRVLASAGFERRESETTSVRGHHRTSPGFEVIGSAESWERGLIADKATRHITVHHETHNSFDYEKTDTRPRAEIVAEALAAYLTALEAAGYDAEIVTRRTGQQFILVTGRHA